MYPLISEYVESIKSAEDNFKELSCLRPVLDVNGEPVMSSGNFAVVFKMEDKETGKIYALKCFTREQEGREEAYHQIAEELKYVDSSYLVSLRYIDKELFVDTVQTDETEFPVLLMDWVEGKTLDKYLRENLDDKYALEMLAYRFSQLAQWLIPQPFAHGDLKPDNILVREDGTIVLVDYDGMYVPAMKGQKARELGSPDFRHPLRTENDFDEHIDDFPLVSILLSLNAISIKPHLLEGYGGTDRLLFSENEYRNTISSGLISKCACVNKIPSYYPITIKFIRYLWDLLVPDEKDVASFDLSMESPVPLKNRITYIYSHDVEKYKVFDDIGYAKYSEDETKILQFWDTHAGSYMGDEWVDPFHEYVIKDGTITICDNAFKDCKNLRLLSIPDSVKCIGWGAFSGCGIRYVKLPLVDFISEHAFDNCSFLHTIIIPYGTFSLFSEMLPRNVFQLKEFDKAVICDRVRLYFNSNKAIHPFDLMQSLFGNGSFFSYLHNSNKSIYTFKKNNDGSGSVLIKDDNSYIDPILHIKDVENVDELANFICDILLDSGVLYTYNPYQYIEWNLNRKESDKLF